MLNRSCALLFSVLLVGGLTSSLARAYDGTAETPYIVRGSRAGTDRVQYPDGPDRHFESWEIMLTVVPDGTFLNYSRFTYGDLIYNGLPTHVCFTKTGGRKFIGVSEKPDRLQKALDVVVVDQVGPKAHTGSNCRAFSALLRDHPEDRDLQKLFESL